MCKSSPALSLAVACGASIYAKYLFGLPLADFKVRVYSTLKWNYLKHRLSACYRTPVIKRQNGWKKQKKKHPNNQCLRHNLEDTITTTCKGAMYWHRSMRYRHDMLVWHNMQLCRKHRPHTHRQHTWLQEADDTQVSRVAQNQQVCQLFHRQGEGEDANCEC